MAAKTENTEAAKPWVTDVYNTLCDLDDKAKQANAARAEALGVFRNFQKMRDTTPEMNARFPQRTRNTKGKVAEDAEA